MIFGDKADFAIEAMIEPQLKPPSSPWGRMCVWVSGTAIGDFADPNCGLGGACQSFMEICDVLNDMWDEHFSGLNDLEIWNFLDGLLYGYHGNVEIEDDRSLEQTVADSSSYWKFNFLTNWGEMFDRGGKSFLLKLPDGRLKVLNFDHQANRLNIYFCTEFSFRLAVKGFVTWYHKQEHLLRNA